MSKSVTNTKLVAHEKALEAAGAAIALVMRVPAPLKSIADQVIRSASSVPPPCRRQRKVAVATGFAGLAKARPERGMAGLRPLAGDGWSPRPQAASNLAEGHGRTGRDRLHFWRIAYASAKEVDSHLKLLAQAGVINADRALETFDEVRAMTWRLLNPKS